MLTSLVASVCMAIGMSSCEAPAFPDEYDWMIYPYTLSFSCPQGQTLDQSCVNSEITSYYNNINSLISQWNNSWCYCQGDTNPPKCVEDMSKHIREWAAFYKEQLAGTHCCTVNP